MRCRRRRGRWAARTTGREHESGERGHGEHATSLAKHRQVRPTSGSRARSAVVVRSQVVHSSCIPERRPNRSFLHCRCGQSFTSALLGASRAARWCWGVATQPSGDAAVAFGCGTHRVRRHRADLHDGDVHPGGSGTGLHPRVRTRLRAFECLRLSLRRVALRGRRIRLDAHCSSSVPPARRYQSGPIAVASLATRWRTSGSSGSNQGCPRWSPNRWLVSLASMLHNAISLRRTDPRVHWASWMNR